MKRSFLLLPHAGLIVLYVDTVPFFFYHCQWKLFNFWSASNIHSHSICMFVRSYSHDNSCTIICICLHWWNAKVLILSCNWTCLLILEILYKTYFTWDIVLCCRWSLCSKHRASWLCLGCQILGKWGCCNCMFWWGCTYLDSSAG